MDIIYTDLELDFTQNRSLKSVKVKQFDNGGKAIRLYLYNNGQAVTLNATSDSVVINASVNKAVTAYDQPCSFYNVSGGVAKAIEIPITENLTSLSGVEECEIKITDSTGDTAYTATFEILVEKSTATSESEFVLKTIELAKVLADLDERVTSNTENIEDLLSGGGGGGSSSTAILNKLGSSQYTTEEYIDYAKTEILNKLGTDSEETVKSLINLSGISILNKLGSSESTIEDRLTTVQNGMNEKVTTAQNVVLTKLGTSSTPIDTTLTFLKSNLSSDILDSRNSILTELAIETENIKNEVLDEITNVREELETKHDILIYEIQKIKREILSVFSSLADELAVGNGTVSGQSALVMQGAISQPYVGKDEYNEQK